MKQQWRCVSALKFGTLSTCSTSIPRWPRRSKLLPSHASKIRRNSPAARNNFPQVKTCRQSRTLTRDGKRAPNGGYHHQPWPHLNTFALYAKIPPLPAKLSHSNFATKNGDTLW